MSGSPAMLLPPLPSSSSPLSIRFLTAFLNPLSAATTTSSPCSPLFQNRLRLCCLAECIDDSDSPPLTEKPWAAGLGGRLKAPTAPWMKEPLLLPAEDVLDFSGSRRKKRTGKPRGEFLSEKIRGGRSRHAMKRIVQSISRLGEEVHRDEEDEDNEEQEALAKKLERIIGGAGQAQETTKVVEIPWVNAEKPMVLPRAKKNRVVTASELVLPEAELTRLRAEARKMVKWVKAKKAGVTDDVVDEVRATWRRKELAMVKFVEPLSRNMDRAREIVEIKTGGLVVWCKRNALVIFRGNTVLRTSELHASSLDVKQSPSSVQFHEKSDGSETSSHGNEIADRTGSLDASEEAQFSHVSQLNEVINHSEFNSERLYEKEVNRLLDGLGPRFIDWWWPKPLPVDADLLPEIVPGFKPPFRLCPTHVRSKLTSDELMHLRKLSRPLPTHFALGKNSRMQGLAAAILKLWEKSLIVKIAVKRGIARTNDKQMSNELKHLTGGILILRNKFFIILYRGKDFVPPKVANSIYDRNNQLKDIQLQEEEARAKATYMFSHVETMSNTSCSGSFLEFEDLKASYGPSINKDVSDKVKIEAEHERLSKELRIQERQLQLLQMKIEKSEKDLAKISSKLMLSKQATDLEFLTEEERRTFQRIGLKMDEFILLGRRGVYDGTIASIHMNWKHREIVKVITMQKSFSRVTLTASLLEIESGGILVSIEKLRKGHAIIIYRGKNYRAPIELLPKNLLTKKEAFEKSLMLQRRGSLKYFAHQRQQSIWELQSKLRALRAKI